MQDNAMPFLQPLLGELLHHPHPDEVLLLLLLPNQVHFAAWQRNKMSCGCQHSLFANRVWVQCPGMAAVPPSLLNESI